MSEPKAEAKEPIKAEQPEEVKAKVIQEPVAEVKEESKEKSFFAMCKNFFAGSDKEEPKAEEAKEVKADSRDLKEFMAKFGDAEGARMFADNVSYAEAQDKHIENLTAKVAELEAKLGEKETIIEANKKDIGGDVLALNATEPKASGGRKIRFAD